MGKVLRALVIVVFLLVIAALVLAGLNFKQREVLIGRTHAMENMFIKVVKTLETTDPVDVPQPGYPQRDVSPVTSRELDNPEVSAFWDSYNHKFEPSAQAIPTLDFDTPTLRMQLRQFYRLNGLGKNEIDPLSGKPYTTGKGTMDELLQQAFERAKRQNEVLNKTRAELPRLRDELISTIEELNRVKKAGRTDKKTIDDLNARIALLQDEKAQLQRQIERLEEEKRGLSDELLQAKNDIEKAKEEYVGLEDQYKKLKRMYDDLIGKGRNAQSGDQSPNNMENVFTPGEKGKIVALNEQWKFVVVEFSDEFMKELLGPDLANPLPQVQMMVRRPGLQGAAGDFVTRVKLRQVIRGQNVVVADVLVDWQQVPLQNGDVVYF